MADPSTGVGDGLTPQQVEIAPVHGQTAAAGEAYHQLAAYHDTSTGAAPAPVAVAPPEPRAVKRGVAETNADAVAIALAKKKRLCRYPGCTKVIKSQGHCQRHGARAKRCKVEGCDKQAQGTHDGELYSLGAILFVCLW